jgi:hypothetical protein
LTDFTSLSDSLVYIIWISVFLRCYSFSIESTHAIETAPTKEYFYFQCDNSLRSIASSPSYYETAHSSRETRFAFDCSPISRSLFLSRNFWSVWHGKCGSWLDRSSDPNLICYGWGMWIAARP